MVTPETLTDERVRALRGQLHDQMRELDGSDWLACKDLSHFCYVALGERGSRSRGDKRRARQRVCDYINAREGR